MHVAGIGVRTERVVAHHLAPESPVSDPAASLLAPAGPVKPSQEAPQPPSNQSGQHEQEACRNRRVPSRGACPRCRMELQGHEYHLPGKSRDACFMLHGIKVSSNTCCWFLLAATLCSCRKTLAFVASNQLPIWSAIPWPCNAWVAVHFKLVPSVVPYNKKDVCEEHTSASAVPSAAAACFCLSRAFSASCLPSNALIQQSWT